MRYYPVDLLLTGDTRVKYVSGRSNSIASYCPSKQSAKTHIDDIWMYSMIASLIVRRLALLPLVFLILFPLIAAASEIKDQAYRKLDLLRAEKKEQLYDYLARIQAKADAIQYDEVMKAFFLLKRKYIHLKKLASPPEHFAKHIEELKTKIRSHYLWNYLLFYDILFVDKGGDVFYTIRQQSDYGKNLFRGKLAKTDLSRRLRDYPRKAFVDYQYYYVSTEPSAFFVVPMEQDEKLEGWLVLQCAINKINDIFSRKASLGITGEIFLVNRNQYMLTDSRFSGESSILRQHLSKENIQSKFEEGSGHKIVVDYRGRRALTAFDVCNLGGAEWLIIAKIDEDEVLTKQYKKSDEQIKKRLLKSVTSHNFNACQVPNSSGEQIEVDMDEFCKVRPGQVLRTYGVSSCTAIVLYLPGKFSYMAHISNMDHIYGGATTNLVGRVMDRIERFDIYPYQKRNLQVTLIANHTEAIIPAVDMLVERGVFLSQIKFMHKEDAKYASPIHDCQSGRTLVDWIMNRQTGHKFSQCSSDVPSLDQLFKHILGYPTN